MPFGFRYAPQGIIKNEKKHGAPPTNPPGGLRTAGRLSPSPSHSPACSSPGLSTNGDQNQPETVVVEAKVRDAVAIRYTAELRIEVPAAAAKDAGLAVVRPLGIVRAHSVGAVWTIPIAAPLPHIAAHIIKTQLIGLLLSAYMQSFP